MRAQEYSFTHFIRKIRRRGGPLRPPLLPIVPGFRQTGRDRARPLQDAAARWAEPTAQRKNEGATGGSARLPAAWNRPPEPPGRNVAQKRGATVGNTQPPAAWDMLPIPSRPKRGAKKPGESSPASKRVRSGAVQHLDLFFVKQPLPLGVQGLVGDDAVQLLQGADGDKTGLAELGVICQQNGVI